MAYTKQEYDYKLINLVTQQLTQVEKLHGYTVQKLTLTRDIDGFYDYEIESEIINSGRQL